MCVCDTQAEAGQRISTEYVTAVVSSGTGHSGILTRVESITVDSAVTVSWAGEGCCFTGASTANDTFIVLWATKGSLTGIFSSAVN